MSKGLFKEIALVLISLSLIFIFGCSENSSITQPINEVNPIEKTSVSAEPGWFGLPEPVFKNLQNSFSVEKVILAEKNSSIRMKEDYESERGMCKVDVNVEITKGSISEDTKVTMTLDTETGLISFTPQMKLKKDALIEIKFTNVDLSGSKGNGLDFVYLSPFGSYKSIVRQSVKLKADAGELTLRKGILPHLSNCLYVDRENSDKSL